MVLLVFHCYLSAVFCLRLVFHEYLSTKYESLDAQDDPWSGIASFQQHACPKLCLTMANLCLQMGWNNLERVSLQMYVSPNARLDLEKQTEICVEEIDADVDPNQ